MLPGGSGYGPFSRMKGGRQIAAPFPPASRVSISELLGAVLLCQDEEVGCDLRNRIWQDI